MSLNIRYWLMSIYRDVKASFWLIPLCMILGALVLGWVVVELDVRVAGTADPWLQSVRLSAEGARSILSTIAGSMMTVASLVFSMTLVALSLVAQQLGPRILQFFMADRPTQIVLGLFIATFLFAMVVLGSVGLGRGDSFVPKIGVFVCAALAIVAFAAVILFVHHIARQIQADVVIFDTAEELREATRELAENKTNGDDEYVDRDKFEEIRSAFENQARTISLERPSGYVQFIDTSAALKLAAKHDIKIAFGCRPGQFILQGRRLMTVSPPARVDDDLAGQLASVVQLGSQRTREQRVEFEMLALVEIALRALSKGINDPFTAISCIDWLTAGLAQLLKRYPDHRIIKDKEDRVRVLEYPQTFPHYLNQAFNPVREAAKDLPIVLDRLHLALTDLKAVAVHDAQRQALADQLAKLDAVRP